MSPSPIPVNLLRYLITWRVNSAFVWQPHCFSVDLALLLGSIISDRLATAEAGPWRKAMAPLLEYHQQQQLKKKQTTLPPKPWPIEAVLLPYPSKAAYGEGELIMWELKLLGKDADHGLFLELILPAMEEASYKVDTFWPRQNRVGGHFDVYSVAVARGLHWEPMVQEGRLDLRYRATPVQWLEGLTFAPATPYSISKLLWFTPFAFDNRIAGAGKAPSLQTILESLLWRIADVLQGKHNTPTHVMASLNAEQSASLQAAQAEAAEYAVIEQRMVSPKLRWPGDGIGRQFFSKPLSPALLRYLELASILHVGKYTHYGCGTFRLE